MSILQQILSQKKAEVARAKERMPVEMLRQQAQSQATLSRFTEVLKGNSVSIIAEIKKTSPSRGVLDNAFDHKRIAREYETGGAKALSVLTDEKFFQGHSSYIKEVKSVCSLPVLRKDFIIDEYQIFESRALGADAILLIVRILDTKQLKDLHACALTLGLDVLVETHSEEDIESANSIGARIIGINNRDLESFDVSLEHSLRLRKHISPTALAISESGISSAADIERLRKAGFDAALVGESLMTRKDRISALKTMIQT